MFESFKLLDTIAAQKLLQADFQILMKYMNKQRAKTGWDNPHQQAKKEMAITIKKAM